MSMAALSAGALRSAGPQKDGYRFVWLRPVAEAVAAHPKGRAGNLSVQLRFSWQIAESRAHIC